MKISKQYYLEDEQGNKVVLSQSDADNLLALSHPNTVFDSVFNGSPKQQSISDSNEDGIIWDKACKLAESYEIEVRRDTDRYIASVKHYPGVRRHNQTYSFDRASELFAFLEGFSVASELSYSQITAHGEG